MSTITGDWKSLTGEELRAQRPILASTLEQLCKNAVALYEASEDAAAPSSASAQEYVGHDHGFGGGAPIVHGLVAHVDGIDTPIRTLTPTGTPSSDKKILTRIPVNPGIWLQRNAHLDVWIRAMAVNRPFKVRANEGPELLIEPTDETEGPKWYRMQCRAGDLNNYTDTIIFSMELAGDAGSSPRFDLHAITVSETPATSLPHVMGLHLPPQLGSGTQVLRYFGELDPELAGADEWVDTELLTLLEMAIASLFEHVTDQIAPGATGGQYIKGHDHATNGGRAVPMGLCLTTGADAGLSLAALWAQACAVQNTWYFIDQGSAKRRSAGTAGGAITAGTWYFPVSPGIASSGNPPTTAPSLYSELQVTFSGAASPTVEARLYNVNTGTYSETITLTGGGATDSFNRVPCAAGVWNELTLEVRCTSHAAVTVDLFWLTVHEIPWVNTTQVSDVGSGGNRILGTPQGRP